MEDLVCWFSVDPDGLGHGGVGTVISAFVLVDDALEEQVRSPPISFAYP